MTGSDVRQALSHAGFRVSRQKLAKASVYRWIETKGLPAHRVGRLWKFKLSEMGGCVPEGPARMMSTLAREISTAVEPENSKVTASLFFFEWTDFGHNDAAVLHSLR